MADKMSIDKEPVSKASTPKVNADKAAALASKKASENVELIKEESDDSMDSSQEAEQGRTTNPAEGQDPPKRKGGRRPIYATSEERKQRNRQAQAAFRERRSEYIKQLEEAIQVHEQNIQNLQSAHRNAADECLMLRYKNSLLERILLEKGIDVQAELYAKTGSPNLGPTHVPQNMVPTPPMQRAIMNRHHQSRRSTSNLPTSNLAPKMDGSQTQLPPPIRPKQPVMSPKTRAKPPSHASSPTDPGSASAFGSQTGLSPAASDDMSLVRTSVPPVSMRPQLSPVPMSVPVTAAPPRSRPAVMSPTSNPPAATTTTAANYYPTPAFQNHINQLEQEYETGVDILDAQADLLEESDLDSPKGPAPYAGGFAMGNQPQPMDMSPMTTSAPARQMPTSSANPQYPSMTQLLESNHEWDPLGLNMMSMSAFPSQFSFDQSNMR